MRIGLFGGTFNPIHIGHMALAQECWYELDLDKVIFIPAYIPPHKDLEGDISMADRLTLVRHALEGDDRFGISTYEIDSKGTSYTIKTIEHFRQKYQNDELFFLAGSDWAETFPEWKDADRILELVKLIIAKRLGWKTDCSYREKVRFVDIPSVDISSSYIRERIKKCKPIDYLVPAATVKYIRNKGLYK